MPATNEGIVDRALRVTAGLVLLYLGQGGIVTGAGGTAVTVVAALLLITGVIGWCPLYALLGIDTTRKTGGSALPRA